MPVPEITAARFDALLSSKEQTLSAESLNKLRARTSQIFSYASMAGGPWEGVSLRYVGLTEQLLTVREVAQRLRATVYKLCASSELAHLRISNAIRVAQRDLVEFIARRRSR